MDFFKKTWVKVTAWIVLFIAIVVLLLGGVTQAEISDGLKVIVTAVAAVASVIAFITGHATVKDLKKKLESK